MRPIVDLRVYRAGAVQEHPGRPPVEMRVLQSEYAHDLAMVLVPNDQPSLLRYRVGAPMSLSWGWPGDVQTFVGYVHHLELRQTIATQGRMWVVCVGPSFSLRESRHRLFSDVRAEWVLGQVAGAHKLSAMSRTSDPLSAVVQSGQSDWDLLIGVARRVGATLYCHRTDLRCLSRAVDPSQAVLLSISNALNSGRDGILDWIPVLGETVPTERKAWWEAYGLTDNGGFVGAVAGTPATGVGQSPVFSEILTSRPVHSPATAASITTATAASHRHHQFGDADLTGTAKVHQGVTVQFRGLGAESDGYWFVTRAEHTIEGSQYRTSVRVGRDSVGDASPVSLPGIAAKLPGYSTRRRRVVSGLTSLSRPPSTWDAPESVLVAPDSSAISIAALGKPSGSAAGVLRHGAANLTMWQAKSPRLRMTA